MKLTNILDVSYGLSLIIGQQRVLIMRSYVYGNPGLFVSASIN